MDGSISIIVLLQCVKVIYTLQEGGGGGGMAQMYNIHVHVYSQLNVQYLKKNVELLGQINGN